MVPLGMPMRGDAVTLGNLAGKIAMVEIASHPVTALIVAIAAMTPPRNGYSLAQSVFRASFPSIRAIRT
jgi:hypothetical protein